MAHFLPSYRNINFIKIIVLYYRIDCAFRLFLFYFAVLNEVQNFNRKLFKRVFLAIAKEFRNETIKYFITIATNRYYFI